MVNNPSGMPQLVPYRGNLLLLDMNTDHPVYELNAGGVIKSTQLKLPPGEKLWQFIPSVNRGRTWKVILGQTNEKGSPENGYRRTASRPTRSRSSIQNRGICCATLTRDQNTIQ